MIHFRKVWLAEDHDAPWVDWLFHHPSVMPFTDIDAEFHLDMYAGWHAWVVPGPGGAFLMVPTDRPCELEMHMGVLPEYRGRAAIEAGREVAELELGAGHRLIGRTPLANVAARRFAALCGGVVVGVEDGEEIREWAA